MARAISIAVAAALLGIASAQQAATIFPVFVNSSSPSGTFVVAQSPLYVKVVRYENTTFLFDSYYVPGPNENPTRLFPLNETLQPWKSVVGPENDTTQDVCASGPQRYIVVTKAALTEYQIHANGTSSLVAQIGTRRPGNFKFADTTTWSAVSASYSEPRACAVDPEGNILVAGDSLVGMQPARFYFIRANRSENFSLPWVSPFGSTLTNGLSVRWCSALNSFIGVICPEDTLCQILNVTDVSATPLYTCAGRCLSRALDCDQGGVIYSGTATRTTITITKIYPDGSASNTTFPAFSTQIETKLRDVTVINSTTLLVVREGEPGSSVWRINGVVENPPQSIVAQYTATTCPATAQLAANDAAPSSFAVNAAVRPVNDTHLRVTLLVTYKPNITGRAGPANRQPRVLRGAVQGNRLADVTTLSADDFWSAKDYDYRRGCAANVTYDVAWADICRSETSGVLCYANVSVLIPDVAYAEYFQAATRNIAFLAPYQDLVTSATSGQLYRFLCSGADKSPLVCQVVPAVPLSSVSVPAVAGNEWITSCTLDANRAGGVLCDRGDVTPGAYTLTADVGVAGSVLRMRVNTTVPPPQPLSALQRNNISVNVTVVRAVFSAVSPVILDISAATELGLALVRANIATNPDQRAFVLTGSAIAMERLSSTTTRVSIFVGSVVSGNERLFVSPASLNLTVRIFTSVSGTAGRQMHALEVRPSTLADTDSVSVSYTEEGKGGAPSIDGSTAAIVGAAAGVAVLSVVAAVFVVRRVRAKSSAEATSETSANAVSAAPAVKTTHPLEAPNDEDAVRAFDA